jgi:hypothetical protein
MATRLPDASQQAAADAVVDLIDVGSANTEGKLRIYAGVQPADADSAPVGDLLVEIDLNDPAYGSATSSGTAQLDTTGGISGVGTAAAGAGTDAQSFRVVDKDEGTVFDGAVTGTGGGGELELDNVSVAEAQVVNISSLDYTHPAEES